MDILAKIGLCFMVMVFYLFVFWVFPATYLIDGKVRQYFIFVLSAHLIVIVIGWGSWGLSHLQGF